MLSDARISTRERELMMANQIDHVLVSRSRRRHTVTDVRCMGGPNCDLDHFLVRMRWMNKIMKMQSLLLYRALWIQLIYYTPTNALLYCNSLKSLH